MRFNSKKKNNVIIERKWFAILPIRINGETRWLEVVHVRGYYWLGASGNWWWKNIEFIDKKI
jgi:hypothetical protein